MLPSGRVFGRVVKEDGEFEPLPLINVAGDDLRYFWRSANSAEHVPEFARLTRRLSGQARHAR